MQNKEALKDPKLWLGMLLNWLVPGSGFFIRKEYLRGLAIFVSLNLTVVLALLLKGSVDFPVWTPGSLGSQIISILTFVMQLGYGLFSFVCLANGHLYKLSFLVGERAHAYYELATFYLLVAGGMNYLFVLHFFDRFTGRIKWRERA